MADDQRVRELLEKLLDSGSTPEEVCGSCPELLPVVRARWRQVCRARAELDAMFPPETDSDPALSAPLSEGAPLPVIPGYEVEAVLGTGGMGVVFKARHLRLNRAVALKMMLTGAYAGAHERERFQREAEAVAALRHSNVVQIHDVGDSEGRPYFTMEYVEGGSLAEKLAGTPLPAHDAAAITATLAGAVEAAHAAGIVHRDLKPANVLLTSDGVPKVSDFGLARRVGGEAGLTRTGAAVGTPSYMAPEQARSDPGTIGPAADVYALGAILYELLTGRPPFRAPTPAETLYQVLTADPAPPSRLNGRVPRDAETICLKCLEKQPGRRYGSAAALADDLRRFGRNEPIAARPPGPGERLLRWVRRKPAAATLVGAAFVLPGLALGGGAWLVQQRAERRAEMQGEVSAAVAQSEGLRKGFLFREARELLERAGQRLGPVGHDELRRRVDRARDELELVEKLDACRLRAGTLVDGRYDPAATGPLFVETFARAGLGGPEDDPDTVAARVRGSAVCAEIVAALDDWASVTLDPTRLKWILAVARSADPNPSRDVLRQPKSWLDGDELAKLVQKLGMDEMSPQLARSVGQALRRSGGDAVPLLSATQERFPQDFWLNLELGLALHTTGRSDQAIGFQRAALALRPEVSAVHAMLAMSLRAIGRHDEAIRHFKQAIRLTPNYSQAHNNLGFELRAKGLLDEAVHHFQEAIRSDPEHSAAAHCNLGDVLLNDGWAAEAIGHLQEAVRGEPKVAALAHTLLGKALRLEGRLGEAIEHFREAIELDPKGGATSYYGLANALRDEHRPEEAIDYLQQAVRLDPGFAQAWTALGLTWYEAGRAAVAAAVGRGPEKEQIGEPDRAAKRRQALVWLRASLGLRTKLINEGKAVIWYVTTWQTDPALASVRDAPELAKLPSAERAQWASFWTDVSTLIAGSPAVEGPAFAACGDWAGAADWYTRALKRSPTEHGHFWYEYAAVALLSGDRPGGARACAFLMERCGKKDGPRPYHAARAGTLAPDAVTDLPRLARQVEKELEDNAGVFWSLTERGALAYRAGRFQDAVPFFEKSLGADNKPGRAVVNWLWLALAHHRLGKPEEARRWLAKAQVWLDQYRDGMPARADQDLGLHLHNWLEARVLCREAEALIRPTKPR